MPDDGPPPSCDAACQKIILDADTLEALATVLCDHIVQYKEDGGKYHNPAKVIDALIAAERAVNDATHVVLAEQGYSGKHPFN